MPDVMDGCGLPEWLYANDSPCEPARYKRDSDRLDEKRKFVSRLLG